MKVKALGYRALIEKYKLNVIPHFTCSYALSSGIQRIENSDGITQTYYPSKYWPGETDLAQLEFALKYEGLNLAILASLFAVIPHTEFLAQLKTKPTGKYVRQLWFLYEYLVGIQLEIDDLQQGNYVDLLDPDKYYTNSPAKKVKRQRINDNLLGNHDFCPVVRKTECLQTFEALNLSAQCHSVIANYPAHLLKRALSYLYTRETRSSFEIEKITPATDRIERFVQLLQLAEKKDFCQKPDLIELQNRTVDQRFADTNYRQKQNYVGETIHWQKEIIHFISPKPEDLDALMDGLIAMHKVLNQTPLSAVIHAVIVAYGFVFLHPFEDGNGRIHRFLLHNILARRGFTPEGIMFPLSAILLKFPDHYEASLDAFSKSLMPLIEYTLDPDGDLKVHNQTSHWYRYMDLTVQAEALFGFIEQTLEQELIPELAFLLRYDQCKKAIQAIVDLPDRLLDLFIRCCMQNQGKLSANKRNKHFTMLTDQEVLELEQAYQGTLG